MSWESINILPWMLMLFWSVKTIPFQFFSFQLSKIKDEKPNYIAKLQRTEGGVMTDHCYR